MKADYNFIVYDIETGGLKSTDHAVVEIAMIVLDNDLNEIEEYDNLIVPYSENYKITEGALVVNGLTLDKINKGKDSKEVVKDIESIFKKYKKGRNKPILSGHNIVKSDNLFMEEFFKFHKSNFYGQVSDFFIDTMWWGRMKWQESTDYKLSTCCDNAGIELVDAHRAMRDTRANKDLVKELIMSLRGDGRKNGDSEVRYRQTFEF
jgi:DNA polymerase III alpha subunit (gram-positive type)